MDCEQVQQIAHAYVDGELSNVRTRVIQNHLENCDPCLDRVLSLYTVNRKLDAHRAPSSSDQFRNEVMSQVNVTQSRRRRSRWRRWAGLAATLIVGIALGSFMAWDVNSSLAAGEIPMASTTSSQSSNTGTNRVAYSPTAFAESGDGALADRYFRTEVSGNPGKQGTSVAP